MREAIALAQIDAAASMQEFNIVDPSYGFDPLSLAEKSEKPAKATKVTKQYAPISNTPMTA